MNRFLLLLFLLCFSANAQEQFTLYFDSDKDVPTEDSKAALTEWIKNNPDVKVSSIAAYADTIGNTEYNRLLSIRRAKYLIFELSNYNLLHDYKLITPGEIQSLSGSNSQNRKAVISYTKPKAIVVVEESELNKEVKTAKKGEKLRLKNLNFYGNSGKVLPESEQILSDLLKVMQDNPNLKIDIQGHICCQLDDPVGVSHMRAVSVYEYLLKNGISKKRLNYRSFGGKRPLHPIPESTPREQEENRRVEIEILEN